jgi:carbamoyltransferase
MTYWKTINQKEIKEISSKENPTILGITAYFHDSSACIIKDGKVLAAAEEERFTRNKHDDSFPVNAINFCLNEAKVKEVDAVVFFEDPKEKFERINKTLTEHVHSQVTIQKIRKIWAEKKSPEKIQEKLLEVGLNNKIIFLDHHLSHASSSYFMSGFEEAAILTLDGIGEKNSTTIGFANGKEIRLNQGIEFPDSIGLLYTALTVFLGFRANDDEYKVMGLAPYGLMNEVTNPFYKKLEKLVKIMPDGSFKLNMVYFGHENFENKAFTQDLTNFLGILPRERESKINRQHMDLAAALQMLIEKIVFKILNHLYKINPCDNLVMAGGVALNSVLNGKILSNTPFKRIFIQPAAGDAGTSLGAAKYLQYKLDPQAKREHQTHSSFGPEFTDESIKEFLTNQGIKFRKFNSEQELVETVTRLIHEKKVIGWFQGKMEWGPRALGNRSILASPCYKDMKDILNEKVKHREMFRPFAPVVCIDDVEEFFECDKPIPEPTDYMLMVYPIRKDKQELIPAITHVDGSGRLQTIKKSQNKLYYDLIKKFGEISGTPILVNTSFNIRGEPIVCTPYDAYRCMMGTKIDCLVIGNFIVQREENLKDIWDSEIKK